MFFERHSFVALDLETTGLDSSKDKIIEFAALRIENGKIVDQLELLINPEIEISQTIQFITGITNDAVKDQPVFEAVKKQIQEFVKDSIILGHNVQFDIGFLKENGITVQNKVLDTYSLSSIFLPEEKSLALEVLSENFQIEHKYKHRALGDVIATYELFRIIYQKIKELNTDVITQINELLNKSNSTLKELFLAVENSGKPNNSAQSSFSQTKDISAQLSKNHSFSEVSADFDQLFAQNTNAILEVPFQTQTLFQTSQYLLEKKTQAIGAVYSPKLFNRVIQFFNQAGIKNICIIKNASNYLCLKQWEKFQQKETLTEDELILAVKILIWLFQTKTGDRDEILLLPSEYKLWFSQLSSNDGCTGIEHNDCFWHCHRNKAKEAELVLTYHNILTENFIPKTRKLFVFEARDLEKSFSNYGRKRITFEQFSQILDQFKNHAELSSYEAQIKNLQNNLQLFFSYWFHELSKEIKDFSYPQKIIFNQSLKTNSGIFELFSALKDIFLQIDNLINLLNETPKYKFQIQELKNLQTDLHSFFEDSHENEVRWFHLFPEGEIVLNIDIIELKNLMMPILEKFEQSFFIDENLATISEENQIANYDFKYFKSSLGIEKLEFFEKHYPRTEKAKLEVPNLVSADSVKNVIQNTIEQNKGKTIVLFNSYAVLNNFFNSLVEPLKEKGCKILAQGQGGGSKKIKSIYENNPDKNVIFGIERSFHKEFFSPNVLKTIILMKLVFDPPNDPVLEARQQKYQNAFMEFALPRSILAFKQNHIKLQNHDQNLIVLDNRLTEKRYGKYFLKSIESF